MTQTYFNHPLNDRHTWFSGDKTTKKVLDYVIVEPFVQQYVTDCSVDSQFDCNSDHRIIITSMETPMTKKGRWKPKSRIVNNGKMDLKSLNRCDEVKKSFLDAVA